MLLSIYITLIILGVLTMYVAIFVNDSIANVFLWPVAIILFAVLFFGSYNIQPSDTVLIQENRTVTETNHTQIDYYYESNGIHYTEPGLSWLWLGLAMLSSILFTWDLFKHQKDSWKKNGEGGRISPPTQ